MDKSNQCAMSTMTHEQLIEEVGELEAELTVWRSCFPDLQYDAERECLSGENQALKGGDDATQK